MLLNSMFPCPHRFLLNEGKWVRRFCSCIDNFFLYRKLKQTSELNAAGANLEPAVVGVLRLGSVSLGMEVFYLWEQ